MLQLALKQLDDNSPKYSTRNNPMPLLINENNASFAMCFGCDLLFFCKNLTSKNFNITNNTEIINAKRRISCIYIYKCKIFNVF